jgi:hypothetical protein
MSPSAARQRSQRRTRRACGECRSGRGDMRMIDMFGGRRHEAVAAGSSIIALAIPD